MRLDGTRPRATVASKVMESGKTAEQGNGHPCVPTARQAKRAGPDLEAGPEASAERSEGTMEARMGRDAAGGSMRYAHDSATGHVSWPGTRKYWDIYKITRSPRKNMLVPTPLWIRYQIRATRISEACHLPLNFGAAASFFCASETAIRDRGHFQGGGNER